MSPKLIVLACLAIVSTSAEFRVGPSPSSSLPVPRNAETTYAGQILDAIPNDDGKSNFGDLIHKSRQARDTLVLRELLINEFVYDTDASFTFENYLSGNARNITAVRAVNLGRERAYVQTITTNPSGYIKVVGEIRRGHQIRLLVDVYALP